MPFIFEIFIDLHSSSPFFSPKSLKPVISLDLCYILFLLVNFKVLYLLLIFDNVYLIRFPLFSLILNCFSLVITSICNPLCLSQYFKQLQTSLIYFVFF